MEKLLPQLRFPGFEGDWEEKKLGKICTFFSGGTPKSTDKSLYNGNIPFIGSGNIYDYEVKNYITEEALNNSSSKMVEIGDLLYALYGANSGEVAISKMKGAINQAILCIRTKSELIEFLHSLLLLNKDKIVAKYLQGGQGNLSADIIKKLKYPFPTLPEQTKIATFLTEVDKKLAALKQKKSLLEQYKKGVMQQIFSQELRFKDDNGNDYADWEEKKLGEVAEIVGGGTPETIKNEFWNGNIQWFTPTEIKSDFVSKSIRTITELGLQKSSAKLLPVGTILLTTRATIGEVSIAKEICSTNQGFQSLICKVETNNIFLFNWIKKNKFELIKRANGSTFPEISKSEIEQIEIQIPSFPEQTKIANFLSAIDEKINHCQGQIEKTEVWKKGLLQQLFV